MRHDPIKDHAMAVLLWSIVAGALALLGLAYESGDPDLADHAINAACCLAAFGLCVGSLALPLV